MYTEPPFLLNHGTPDLKFLIFLRLKPNMQVKILCGRFERVRLPCYTLAIRDCKPAPTHVSALLHTLPGPSQVARTLSGSSISKKNLVQPPYLLSVSSEKAPSNNPTSLLCGTGFGFSFAGR